MANGVDIKGRRIDPDKLFIYAGEANMSINPAFFKKALKGGFPKGGKRYHVQEFFSMILKESNYKSVLDLTTQTNCYYEGFQTIKINNYTKKYDWWLYYVPIEKLSDFNRIEKNSNSAVVAGMILKAHDFKLLSSCIVNKTKTYQFLKDNNSKKLVVIESKLIKNGTVTNIENIYLLLPSEFGDKGYTYCNTTNIFFDTFLKDPSSKNILQYTEKTWEDICKDNQFVSVSELITYIMEDFVNDDCDLEIYEGTSSITLE